MINYFSSIRDCFRFVSCREFWHQTVSEGPFSYEKSRAEKLGDLLIRPVFKNADSALKHIREPYMITALTLAALGTVTLVFYPEQCAEFLTDTIPIGAVVKPWMVKFGVYLGTEATILGIGMRTIGRLSNLDLMSAWREKRVFPVPIGTIVEF